MTRAGLAPVSAASGVLWSGYSAKVSKFVYVELYRTTASASAQAHSLSAENVARVGLYVVSESIARYPGSPVPAVAACLSGGSKKGSGSTTGSGQKHKPTFTF